MIYPNGDVFYGKWLDDQRHGKGKGSGIVMEDKLFRLEMLVL